MKAKEFQKMLGAFHEGIRSDIREIIDRIFAHGSPTLTEFRFLPNDEWMWNMEESSYADIEICDSGENTVLAREKVVGIAITGDTVHVITETGTKEHLDYLYGDDAVCLLAFLEETLAALEDGDLTLGVDGILRDKEAVEEEKEEAASKAIAKKYVDLGLRRGGKRVLFAKCNYGAEKPEEYGLLLNHDKAMSIAFPDCAALPGREDLAFLISKSVTRKWVKDYTGTGIAGLVVTGKDDFAGNQIFLPAAGFTYDRETKYAGKIGRYWTIARRRDGVEGAYRLDFYEGDQDLDVCDLEYGASVRPVLILPD